MRRISLVLSVCLLATLLCSCSYHPPINTATSYIASNDSTGTQKIIVVNGKKYTCINEDGTWRCVELADFENKLTGMGSLNASQQNSNIGPNNPNER
ncbi:hypothetical protein HON36_03340 [Candidatus Parcubacteria bacterium]|jgi:hypothetical protein|nr:hypothetical protein [Candidatus Parcubacteria bacterium]